jgi:hypothetical protein
MIDKLTKEQTIKATELLGLLCGKEQLDHSEIYPLFESKEKAEFIFSELEKRNLLKTIPAGGLVSKVNRTMNTRNTFENDLLMKEFLRDTKLDNKEQLEIKIAELTEINLTLQNKQLRTKMLFSIIGFIIGAIATNWKDILIILKLISPPETK